MHGYQEEGTTTTPFDMTVLNGLDRFRLATDAIDRVERIRDGAAAFRRRLQDKLIDHRRYIAEHGDDMPEVRDWQWQSH